MAWPRWWGWAVTPPHNPVFSEGSRGLRWALNLLCPESPSLSRGCFICFANIFFQSFFKVGGWARNFVPISQWKTKELQQLFTTVAPPTFKKKDKTKEGPNHPISNLVRWLLRSGLRTWRRKRHTHQADRVQGSEVHSHKCTELTDFPPPGKGNSTGERRHFQPMMLEH